MDQSEIARLMKASAEAIEDLRQRNIQMRDRIVELEQKGAARIPGHSVDEGSHDELANMLIKGEGMSAFIKKNTPTFAMEVPTRLVVKTQIINATGQNQPLVPAQRLDRIVHAPQQRLTIRGLFNQLPTDSNLIEVPQESSYTSNARPQGDASPGGVEGELKAESAMTFTLATVPVVTLAHWIPASRQILSDAARLAAHLSNRLLYGLALEEEEELLTGTGAANTMNGINNQAAAFTGGATNQTQLDTLAKAANQLAVSNFEPSGFILHPTDWLSVRLEKDTQNRYMFGDPGQMATPMLWGLPVVVTPTQTLGRFTVIDAQRWGYIADRETASVRFSEQHADFFIRNMVAVLCESRVALVTERAQAAVYGTLNHAG